MTQFHMEEFEVGSDTRERGSQSITYMIKFNPKTMDKIKQNSNYKRKMLVFII